MIINATLRNERTQIEYDRCQVDHIVTLPYSEFEYFRRHSFEYYDFISDSLKCLPITMDNTRHCIMVLNDETDDGILVDPQGYKYARYSAYVPNVKQLVQIQYPSLDEFIDRMRSAVDKYVNLAIENQINGKYYFDIEDVLREHDCECFNSELFEEMISEREEFSDIDCCRGEYALTIDKKFLSEQDKTLYQEDIKEICARHTLWILDAEGGIRADFSGCIIKDADFTGVDLSSASFKGTQFSNCNFENACLMVGNMTRAVFENCNFTNVTAEEVHAEKAVFDKCDFTQADFIESHFNNASFINCVFDCISLEKSCIKGTDFEGTIPDAEEIEHCYKSYMDYQNEPSDSEQSL